MNDYYRAMDTLSETIEGIEESLFYEENTLFSTPEVVFFDTTSTYFEGTDADIGEYGLSKDHRGDRKQVVISLVLNEKTSLSSIRYGKGILLIRRHSEKQ